MEGRALTGKCCSESTGGRYDSLIQFVVDSEQAIGYAGHWQHIGAECHFVSPEDPAEQHGCKSVHDHEGRVDRPLLLHDAAIQDGQTGDGLQAD